MSERGNDYSGVADLPPLVRDAAALAQRMGFRNSCAVVYGRLLQVLAGGASRIGEMGSGCGVGTAWMLSGMAAGGSIATVELDEERAAAVRELYAGRDDVTALQGDWRDLGGHGPFDLLFCDGGLAKYENGPEVVDMVAPGGLLVLDDLTPGWDGPDPVRDWWLASDLVRAAELKLAPEHAAIVAERLPGA